MACVNPDGTLTEAARSLLKQLQVSRSPKELSDALSAPLFKVRSSLRKLAEAELIKQEDEGWVITEKGQKVLNETETD